VADEKGFHKAHCDVCDRKTWHYKESGGQNPHCTHHSNWTPGRKRHVPDIMVQGGLGKAKPAEPTEREIRIANKLDMSMWRNAEERYKSHVRMDNASGLFSNASPATAKDPDKTYCSFCGDAVDAIHRLTEKKPVIRKVIDTYKDATGEVVVQEKVVTRVETVHACPNCCLNIRKPIVVRSV
jgi:hypothetical protein